MSANTKNLIAGLMALLLSAGQAALVAVDTFPAQLQRSVAVHYADLNLDRPSLSAYHEQASGLAPRRDSTIAQR